MQSKEIENNDLSEFLDRFSAENIPEEQKLTALNHFAPKLKQLSWDVVTTILSGFDYEQNKIAALECLVETEHVKNLFIDEVVLILTLFSSIVDKLRALEIIKGQISREDQNVIVDFFEGEIHKQEVRCIFSQAQKTSYYVKVALENSGNNEKYISELRRIQIEDLKKELELGQMKLQELQYNTKNIVEEKNIAIIELREKLEEAKDENITIKDFWTNLWSKKRERLQMLKKKLVQYENQKQPLPVNSELGNVTEGKIIFPTSLPCIVCMENDRAMVLDECRHFAMCEDCVYSAKLPIICPLCRTHNTSWTRVYI